MVDRKTNKQIAAELFVSLKTVEAHMRNLFRKLDVSVARGGCPSDRARGSKSGFAFRVMPRCRVTGRWEGGRMATNPDIAFSRAAAS